MTDSIRSELAPFGIHVVVIEPGAIHTVLMARFLPDRAKDRLLVMFYKVAGRRTPATQANNTGSASVAGTPR